MNSGGLNLQYDILSTLFRLSAFYDSDYTELSSFPSMLDQFQSYGDWQRFGSARNPLGLYGETTLGKSNSRGGFSGMTIVSNTNTAAVVTMDVWEPLILSPLAIRGQPAAFVGLDSLTVQINVGNLSRMMSIDTQSAIASTITSINVVSGIGGTVFTAAPALYSVMLVPSVISPIPNTALYSYDRTNRYFSAMPSVAAGASVTTTSQTITIDKVPAQLVFCARQQQSDLTYASSDTFLALTNVNLSWNGQAGLLSNASQLQLWKIAIKNGVNQTFDEWTYYQGSVMVLVPGVDFQIADLEAPNLGGSNWTVQIQASFTNTSLYTIVPTFLIIAISNGVCKVTEGGGWESVDAPITKDDIANAIHQTPAALTQSMISKMAGAGLSGFGFWDDIWGGIKKAGTAALPFLKEQGINLAKNQLKKYTGGRSGRGLDFARMMTGRGLVDDEKSPAQAQAEERASDSLPFPMDDRTDGASLHRSDLKRRAEMDTSMDGGGKRWRFGF